VFLRTFVGRSERLMSTFFITFVRPLLECGYVVWSLITSTNINKLEAVQRSFFSKINGFKSLSYRERLTKLRVHSLPYRRSLCNMLLLYNIFQGTSKIDFGYHFILREPSITRGHSLKLCIPRLNRLVTRRCLIPRCSNQWNSLPDSILAKTSYKTFRRALEAYIVDPCV